MSRYSNAQNTRKITLPPLGPINQCRVPVKLSRDGWSVTHVSAAMPPEIVFPRGAEEHVTTQIHLPPISNLIAEVDARLNGQTSHISRSPLPGSAKPTTLPRVVIECQSLVSRDLAGFSLSEIRNWATVRPALRLPNGITESEVQRRLASEHPPIIGFYLAGYTHLNLAMLLGRHHNCRTISDLVLYVSTICESFVVAHCNDYQGPRGIQVGPGHVPFECVRMIRVVQVTDNYWVGVLSVITHPGSLPRP